MTEERLYLVTYDISSPRRWRRVFKLMQGYGEWLQLSVFQCRLTRLRRAELESRLRALIKQGNDHVLIVDVGSADKVKLGVESLGKTFETIERDSVVI
ncbi:MAG: CRISPR-associated endonuclease Cas2 [bacterium]|nr:CRISPR-associated endonuclease Cas2 [bacterium]